MMNLFEYEEENGYKLVRERSFLSYKEDESSIKTMS